MSEERRGITANDDNIVEKGTIVQMKRERLMDCLWKQQLNKDGSQDVEGSEKQGAMARCRKRH